MRGNAGAGGVMLALGADRVIARDGVVLNPHYETMGLYGSEYWTYVLPRRVGAREASSLTRRCLPVSAAEAELVGLVDDVVRGQPDEFDDLVLEQATRLAGRRDHRAAGRRQARARGPRTSGASRSTPTGPRSSPR